MITPKRKPPKERPATNFVRAKTRKLDCLDLEKSDSTVNHSENIVQELFLEPSVSKQQVTDQSEHMELNEDVSAETIVLEEVNKENFSLHLLCMAEGESK